MKNEADDFAGTLKCFKRVLSAHDGKSKVGSKETLNDYRPPLIITCQAMNFSVKFDICVLVLQLLILTKNLLDFKKQQGKKI